MIKLILCVFAAINLASAQHNGIIWDQPQYQPQYNQPILPQIQNDDRYREAADEPVVGSPLLPIIPPKIFPLGVPGLRFANLNAGHLGGLLYGHSLLGASNPMADEQAEDQYQADPQISAAQDIHGHGGYWWKKKWAEDQAAPIVSSSPCGQSYQVSSPQIYPAQEYQVSSPQEYQAYQPQQTYASYQSPLPQIISEYQPYPTQGYRAQYDYQQQYQPQPAGPIVQPAGTYEDSNAEERTWDWKADKKALIKDKFIHKKEKIINKFDKGHVHIVEPIPVPPPAPQYYPAPQYTAVYSKPVYTKPIPVYTKPAPAAPASYDNYYNAYRSRNFEAEKPLDSEVKSEVNLKN